MFVEVCGLRVEFKYRHESGYNQRWALKGGWGEN
jgi:hypothetical protein